jgi:hypothetical protein
MDSLAGSGANGEGEWVSFVGLHELMTDNEYAEEPGQAV